jgi:hypothetical protein
MSAMKKLPLLVFLIALFAAFPASAAEPTPESYKEAVEPICQKNTEANEKILKGVKGEVRAGKLDAAAKKVRAAARALKQARAQLLQVPKPAEDATKLTKWLGYVKTEVQLFESLAKKLANDEKAAAQKLVFRLYSTANQANSQVLDYQFRYCKFQPSKFI